MSDKGLRSVGFDKYRRACPFAFFTSSMLVTQTWLLLKYSVLCCHQLTHHHFKRLVSLSETAVGEYTAFCICVLNVRLTRISACFTKSLANTVRAVYKSYNLTSPHNPSQTQRCLPKHQHPSPSPSLAVAHPSSQTPPLVKMSRSSSPTH